MDLIGRLSTHDERPVLRLSGEVDLSTLPTLRDHLVKSVAVHAGHTLYVDLDGLSVLDDAGVGMLLGAAGHARSLAGDIVLVCTNDRLLARFALTGLDRAVRVASAID